MAWRPGRGGAIPAAVLLFLLAGCASRPPEAPPAPPPPPAAPTAIVMDAADNAGLQGALRQVAAKPVDEVVGWANPDSGKRGAVKILRDGYDSANRPCREFHSVVILDKLYQHATGFLCRQPDGAWEVADLREFPLFRRPD
ncbi:RT0821/Lpp0805 family surface protein [Rhodocista pekingensis]|uniref:RT0821/Lpp0805 family surface protein n=1 Tax=Rhodocista pekingensis TaxID=201185 RepID=A0ABW2KZ04_9PROT